MAGVNQYAHRRRVQRALIAGFVLLLAFGVATAHLFVWPRLPPLPSHVDAIIELAGPGIADRDGLAIRLSQEGRAPFLVQSTVPAEAGGHTCLPPAPHVTVLCFHPDPGTTRGEAEAIGRMAVAHHWQSVVLVTTPDQAWRARLRLTRCFPGRVYVATSHLPTSEWLVQIPYQWGATIKALIWQRGC